MAKQKIESKIVLATEEDMPEETQPMKLNYKATEMDEECFFLIYNLKIQPSEAYGLHPDRRKWLIARSLHQNQMEQEMMENARLHQQIMPNLIKGK